MVLKLVNTACIGLALAFSLSIQAQENHINEQPASKTIQVSEEVIVVEQKAQAPEGLQIAVAPNVADAHDLVLENLSKRLSGNNREESDNQLDI